MNGNFRKAAVVIFASAIALNAVTASAQKKPAATPDAPSAGAPLGESTVAACNAFLLSIDNNLKAIAAEDSDGFMDNSAPRETNRQLRMIGLRQSNQIALMQMSSMRCSLPTDLLSDNAYSVAAMVCAMSKRANAATVSMGGKVSPDKTQETESQCDRSKWPRTGDTKAKS